MHFGAGTVRPAAARTARHRCPGPRLRHPRNATPQETIFLVAFAQARSHEASEGRERRRGSAQATNCSFCQKGPCSTGASATTIEHVPNTGSAFAFSTVCSTIDAPKPLHSSTHE